MDSQAQAHFEQAIAVDTTWKLLKTDELLGKKKISNGSPPTRDAQFANITQLRERFSRRGNPILSVDTKKKELVGRFKNPGAKERCRRLSLHGRWGEPLRQRGDRLPEVVAL